VRPLTRTISWGWAALLVTQVIGTSPAWSKRTQAQLAAAFEDRGASAPRTAEDPRNCIVSFVDMTDERTSPEIVGVINRRGVLAPQDKQTWFHAVLRGLESRGVLPVFGPGTNAVPTTVTAHFKLRTAWISNAADAYNSNVVVHLNARGSASQSLDQDYRGRSTRTAYWSGGVDTLQSAIDGAFADALNTMAIDLKRLCKK
jgi:hypothetical protein